MNDARFTELLNLHLDHETSPAETAELEAELQRTPARRQQYRDYCRMQRACAQLFEREQAQAPASFALAQALRVAEDKAAAPARRVFFPPAAAFAGLGALAACVVFVLVRQAPAPSTAPAGPAVAAVAPAPVAAVAPAAAPIRPGVSLASYAPPRADAVSLNADWRDSDIAAPTVSPDHDVAALMQDSALPAIQPVVVDDFVMEPRPAMRPATATLLQGSREPAPGVQFISFQFQR